MKYASSQAKKMPSRTHRIARTPRTRGERFADACTAWCGTSTFLIFHLAIFAGWIFWNMGFLEGFIPVDPFPFPFLTTVVSLEAIILSIIVLMSQNRAERVANIRDEVDLEVNIQSEREVTEILRILVALEKKILGLKKHDTEVGAMLRETDLAEIETRVIRALERADR